MFSDEEEDVVALEREIAMLTSEISCFEDYVESLDSGDLEAAELKDKKGRKKKKEKELSITDKMTVVNANHQRLREVILMAKETTQRLVDGVEVRSAFFKFSERCDADAI